jgi:1,2-dihydroxy-3-keto-5-methylthiopentene dioxygenase
MAVVRIPDEQRTISEFDEVVSVLRDVGIDYERWEPAEPLPEGASAEEILEAYSEDVERLKREGGYVTADVIDLTPETPKLEEMLNKFNVEHWHDEDEVRFVIEGSGLFHIHPPEGKVLAIEVEAGDLIRVPRGTRHWFDLCETHTIRAIRLFQDTSGWTPHYTDSGVDAGYQPVCLGPTHIPIATQT